MLQLQESTFSNLLMQPPRMVQPNTPSRTMIGQLHTHYECIQKEIALTKAEIASMKQVELNHEKENMTAMNKVNRARIRDIMKLLESKQKELVRTKPSSLDLNQLKSKALIARRQWEDIRRREQVLEHERDVTIKTKNQLKHVYESIEHYRIRCERELALYAKDLCVLREEAAYIRERNTLMKTWIDLTFKQRRQWFETAADIKTQLKVHTETLLGYVRTHLQAMETEMRQVALLDAHHAAHWKEVTGLVTKTALN